MCAARMCVCMCVCVRVVRFVCGSQFDINTHSCHSAYPHFPTPSMQCEVWETQKPILLTSECPDRRTLERQRGHTHCGRLILQYTTCILILAHAPFELSSTTDRTYSHIPLLPSSPVLHRSPPPPHTTPQPSTHTRSSARQRKSTSRTSLPEEETDSDRVVVRRHPGSAKKSIPRSARPSSALRTRSHARPPQQALAFDTYAAYRAPHVH